MSVILKVEVNQDACIGCGVCVNVCGEVFELENALSQLREEYQGKEVYEGEIPDDIDCVETAIKQCPVDAIS